ncbi:cyclic nucleotide-binding domain-containing protein [Xanthobacter sp. KR7-65]|uniref:cyclic nucleotide-binding domain-containing protein n=1 Tax=Xanthobacter sp. KR7-65 TaxID=3156612 RepID=UPI0032B4EE42
MSIDRHIALLRGVATFDMLSEPALELVAESAQEMRLAAGEVLFRTNDIADCAYVVVSGRIRLLDERKPDAPRLVKEVRAGALIGETALIIPTPRPAGAVAGETTVLLRLPRAAFVTVLERHPEVTAKFRRAIARRLEGTLRALDTVRVKLEDQRARRRR